MEGIEKETEGMGTKDIPEVGRQLITVFLPTITKFNQFLYTFSCNNTLTFNKNNCRLL